MALGNGSLVRCVKHPSHLSTGFCSLCLFERLSTVGLTKSNLDKTNNFNGEILEISIDSPEFEEKNEKPKTTLRALFELESKLNFGDEFESKDASIKEPNNLKVIKSIKNGGSTEEIELHNNCSIESPKEIDLKRSSSLRCACEWISCCNNCESSKISHNLSKVWDNSIIIPLKRSIVLKRSLSESCKDRKLDKEITIGDRIANVENSGVDLQKNELKFGRSWSLRCSNSTSGNKGFLRYYFGPLRNSKRGVNRNMKKKKGLFGIFGFYDLS